MEDDFLFIFTHGFSGAEIFNTLLEENHLFNGTIHPLNYKAEPITQEDLLQLKDEILQKGKYKVRGTSIMHKLFLAIIKYYPDFFSFLEINPDKAHFMLYTRKEIEEQILSIYFSIQSGDDNYYHDYSNRIKKVLAGEIAMDLYSRQEQFLFSRYKIYEDFFHQHSLQPWIVDFEDIYANSQPNLLWDSFDVEPIKIPDYYIDNYFSIKAQLSKQIDLIVNEKLYTKTPTFLEKSVKFD